jgi:hypothetical protein
LLELFCCAAALIAFPSNLASATARGAVQSASLAAACAALLRGARAYRGGVERTLPMCKRPGDRGPRSRDAGLHIRVQYRLRRGRPHRQQNWRRPSGQSRALAISWIDIYAGGRPATRHCHNSRSDNSGAPMSCASEVLPLTKYPNWVGSEGASVARSHNARTISPAPNVARGVTTLNRLVLERDAATTADSDANRVQTNVDPRQSSFHTPRAPHFRRRAYFSF